MKRKPFAYPRTQAELATQIRNRKLATAPFSVVRYIPGKSWAGALISNLDDAFGIGRLGRGHGTGAYASDYDSNHPVRRWEEELVEAGE